MKKVIWLFLVLIVGLVACDKEEVEPPANPDPQEVDFDPGKATSASAYGIVTDEQGAPVADAAVRMGNKSAMTDENGVFRIQDAQVGEKLAYVTVDKGGFFQGSRSFVPTMDSNPFVRIKLLTLDFAGSVSATAGGAVTTPEGVRIDFPENGFVDMAGQAYTGSVNVAVRYLDPQGSDLAEIMPGNLYGFSREGETVALATFGMVGVEWFGDQAQELQLADEQTAVLSMPLSGDLLANAPATIPLWHFDETHGIWIEEGEAMLSDEKYVGEVSHFSFWNCDAPFPVVHLQGGVFWKDPANPIQDVKVTVSVFSSSLTGVGYSGEDGIFDGDIPSNEELLLKVFDSCNEVIYAENIGPFTSDVVLDAIILNEGNFDFDYTFVTGTLVDCAGDPVSDGYIELVSAEKTVIEYVNADGTFSAGILTCDDLELTIVGVNLADAVQSDPQEYSDPSNPLELGDLEACDVELDEFIQYELDGVDYLLTEFVYAYDSLGVGTGFEFGAFNNPAGSLGWSMWVEGTGVGTHPAGTLFMSDIQQATILLPNITVTVTEYGTNAGELIRGTFAGDFDDPQGQNHTIEGEFKAIREF